MSKKGAGTLTQAADTVHFTNMAETIYKVWTQEEAMVKDLLDRWQKGGHGYVPDKKGGNTV